MNRKKRTFFDIISIQLHVEIWKLFVLLIILVLVFRLPCFFLEKPKIEEVIPNRIVEDSAFNTDMSLVLKGENLQHIVGVFINGIWEPECYVQQLEEGKIKLILPEKCYAEPGNYKIQLQTRVNSDLTAISKKINFRVLSTDAIKVPVISKIDEKKLKYEGELVKRIVIEGDNLDENSKVCVDDRQICTEYRNGELVAYIPFDMWITKESIKLRIEQFFEGVSTHVYSADYIMETQASFDGSESNYNEYLMVEYLKALKRDNYLVLFSARDDASVAVTAAIVNAMKDLGLNENLTGKLRQSYAAVLNGQEVLYEQSGDSAVVVDLNADGIMVHVESAGMIAGNNSAIKINGMEYSLNTRGLNIVVYDKENWCVVDRVCFDMYEGLMLCR